MEFCQSQQNKETKTGKRDKEFASVMRGIMLKAEPLERGLTEAD